LSLTDIQRMSALTALAFVTLAVGLIPVSAACFLVLAAHFRLLGQTRYAVAVSIVSFGLPLVLLNSLVVALACAAGAAMGFVVAALVERQWSFGWRLALMTGLAYVAIAGAMLSAWPELRHNNTIFINARIAELNAQSEVPTQWVEMFRWSDLNYDNIALGSAFGSVLIIVAVALSVLDRWSRGPEEIRRGRPSGFQRARVPDWVVWVAIATALLWYADYRWPHPALRAVSWNLAIGLNCLYWLNGVSVLLFGMTMLRFRFVGVFLVLSGLIVFGFWPLLGVFGLFDTWFDFRMRARRVAMLRRVVEWRGGPPE